MSEEEEDEFEENPDFEFDFDTIDHDLNDFIEQLDELEEPTMKELCDIVNRQSEIMIAMCTELMRLRQVTRVLDKSIVKLCNVGNLVNDLKKVKEDEPKDEKLGGFYS